MALESDALKILEDDENDETNVEVEVVDSQGDETDNLKNISEEDAKYLVNTLNAAVDYYKKYLELKPQSDDRDEVAAQIKYLEETSYNYAKKYKLVKNSIEVPDDEG